MNHPHDPVAICEACGLTIEYVYPPIPIRQFDWIASVKNDPEHGAMGNGKDKYQAAWGAMWEIYGYWEDLYGI